MDTAPADRREPYEHALPIRELTSVRIFAPGAATPSPALPLVLLW